MKTPVHTSSPAPRRARAFIAATTAAGVMVLGTSVNGMLHQPATLGWCVLAVLGVVTGYLTLKVPGIQTRFSLSDVLVFTSILLFGPETAAIVAAIDALAASLRFNHREPQVASRTMFNVAAAAVSVWVPGHLFLALLGGGSIASFGAFDARAVSAVLVLIASQSLLNTSAVAAVLALTRREPIVTVWRQNFAWVWVAHAWSGLVATGIAVYAPHVTVWSLLAIMSVGGLGYATVRIYFRKAEESTGHLQKLNDLYLATIKALAMAIDAKDQVTHGHIRRVQVYAVGLARALGVDDELAIKGIEAGALLHDTGKIAVPEHILNKPGKLNAQEYELMKTHVTVGAEILSGIHFPYPVIPFVRHHHENWDGTGYPDGLAGEAIPLGARVLSVVDCFDALTSDRPYRRALSTEAALDILRDRSGNMYDPRVVEKFIEVLPALTASLAEEDLDPGVAAPPESSVIEALATGAVDEPRDSVPALDDVPRLAAGGLTREELAFVVTNRLKRALRFTTCAVYAQQSTDDRLEAIHVAGRHADLFRHSHIRVAEGLSGWVAAYGQTVTNANPVLDLLGPAAGADVQLASALVVPFSPGQGSRGALAFYASSPDAFTLEQTRIATAAAAQLSSAFNLVPAGDRSVTDAQARSCA